MEMLLVGIVAFVIPGALTVWNIYNCFAQRPKLEKLISRLTIFIGGIFYFALFTINYEEAGDWYEQVNTMRIARQYTYAGPSKHR